MKDITPPAEAVANGWYWYNEMPVQVMDIGGAQIMRGYDFTTKEEFRIPVQNINTADMKRIYA